VVGNFHAIYRTRMLVCNTRQTGLGMLGGLEVERDEVRRRPGHQESLTRKKPDWVDEMQEQRSCNSKLVRTASLKLATIYHDSQEEMVGTASRGGALEIGG
jgi:hypothetical protein